MKKFDVAIIGSGLGGLLTGHILAREGMHVGIFEKNPHPGGCMQAYTKLGHQFDTGLHYIGGAAPGQNLHQYFKYFGLFPDLPVKQLNTAGFERIRYKDKEYNWAMGYQQFTEGLKLQFPTEHAAIDRYVHDMQETCRAFPLYNLESKLNDNKASHYSVNLYTYLQKLTHNDTLRTILLGNNLLYAAEKERTPFYLHALINNAFINGAYRVSGGSEHITNPLVAKLQKFGAEIHTSTPITQIAVTGNQATALCDDKGQKYEARHIISAIHPAATLNLIDAPIIRKIYRKRITEMHNSTSAFAVYLVLKPGSFPYLNENYYVLNQDTPWVANKQHKPEDYFLFLTPHQQGHEHYAPTATLLSLMPHQQAVAQAHAGQAAYLAFKKRQAQRLMDAAKAQFPQLNGAIQHYFAATPLTYERFLGAPQGSIYGTMRDSRSPLASKISVRTKIENLWFAGQNANVHGVLGTTISAVIAASQLIDLPYLLNKIKNA